MKTTELIAGHALRATGYLLGLLFVTALFVFGVPSTGGDIAAAIGILAGAVGAIWIGQLLVDLGRADHI